MQLELSFQVPEANLIAKNMSKLVTLFTQQIRFLHLLLMSEASMLIIECRSLGNSGTPLFFIKAIAFLKLLGFCYRVTSPK